MARENAAQGNVFPPSGFSRRMPESIRNLLTECLNANSEENVRSRNLGQALLKAARISPRGGNVPRSWLNMETEEEDPSTSRNTSATSSRATTSPPGAEISAMEESLVNTSTRSSINRSELEAMGASSMFVDDLSISVVAHESTANDKGNPAIADCSLLSGIAHLAVDASIEVEKAEEPESSMMAEDAGPDPLNVGILPAGAESSSTSPSDVEAEVSFPFEDSITLWLASPHNESQIVTINTSDSSANISGLLMALVANDDGNEGGAGGGIIMMAGVGAGVLQAGDEDAGGANVVNMSNQEGPSDPSHDGDSIGGFNAGCLDEEEEARNGNASFKNAK